MDSFGNALADFLMNLTPQFIFEDPQKVRSNLYFVFIAIFLVSLIAGIVMSMGARRFGSGNRLHRAMYQRYGSWLGWLGGVGLVIIAVRYADITLFSKRLWTVLDLFLLLAVAIHFVWYRVRRYPAELSLYREEERRSRYLPPTQRGRAIARGMQRRR